MADPQYNPNQGTEILGASTTASIYETLNAASAIYDLGYSTKLTMTGTGTAGEVVAWDGDQADNADVDNDLWVCGVAPSDWTDTAELRIQRSGELTITSWGLTANSKYYLGTAGALTVTRPTTGNVVSVGYTLTSTETLYIDIQIESTNEPIYVSSIYVDNIYEKTANNDIIINNDLRMIDNKTIYLDTGKTSYITTNTGRLFISQDSGSALLIENTLATVYRNLKIFGGFGLSLEEAITWTGATGENEVILPTNLADAWSIRDTVPNDLMVFTTTTGAQKITSEVDLAINAKISSIYSISSGSGDQIVNSYYANIKTIDIGSNWVYANSYTALCSLGFTTTGRFMCHYARPQHSTSGNVGTFATYVADPYFSNGGGTPTITSVNNIWAAGGNWSSSPATVTTWSQFYISAITGTASVVNANGIYISNITAGSSTNYAIYTNSGLVRFGDDTDIAGTLTVDTIDDTVAGFISIPTSIKVGDGGTTDYTEISSSGDVSFNGSAGFYPRRVSQSAEPANGTGATQIDVGELMVWRDPDDNKTYIMYNDTNEGIRKIELV